MKILLHICCAPCTIYPLGILRREAGRIEGIFFNPNIHPYLEYKKRLDTVKEYAAREGLEMDVAVGYPIEDFLQKTSPMGKDRCRHCYEIRLRYTAEHARKGFFDAFTSTLLYSRYQNHDLVRTIGEKLAREVGVPFFYRDFREGWNDGQRRARQEGIYRQRYCGCIFSEKERFYQGE